MGRGVFNVNWHCTLVPEERRTPLHIFAVAKNSVVRIAMKNTEEMSLTSCPPDSHGGPRSAVESGA